MTLYFLAWLLVFALIFAFIHKILGWATLMFCRRNHSRFTELAHWHCKDYIQNGLFAMISKIQKTKLTRKTKKQVVGEWMFKTRGLHIARLPMKFLLSFLKEPWRTMCLRSWTWKKLKRWILFMIKLTKFCQLAYSEKYKSNTWTAKTITILF